MNRMGFVIAFMVAATLLTAQHNPNRYIQEIFPNITETQNIKFSTHVPQPKKGGGFYEFITGYPLNVNETNLGYVDLNMNIFQPTGDTISKRPVVIVCFGGGFLSGNKDYWSIRLICQSLAKRGFVAAAIDYRLGMNLFDQDLATRAVYRGIQDGRSAVRFFKANASTYNIDTTKIFIGGHSSGAFIALHNQYLDEESERPVSTYAWAGAPDQLGLDGVGDNKLHNGKAAGAFNLAGGLGFTSYINTGDEATVLFHSQDDATVPINSGEPFSQYTGLIFGDDLPIVHGSDDIDARFQALGILPRDYHRYTNRGHGVHEQSEASNLLYADIMPAISAWINDNYLKPSGPGQIYAVPEACKQSATTKAFFHPTDNIIKEWQIEGGTISQIVNDTTVQIQWDTSTMPHQIHLRSFSKQYSAGDEVILNVDLQNQYENHWISGSNNWSTASAWSRNRLPLTCDDVNVPDQIGTTTIEANENATIKSLHLGENVLLKLYPGVTITIKE